MVQKGGELNMQMELLSSLDIGRMLPPLKESTFNAKRMDPPGTFQRRILQEQHLRTFPSAI